MKRKIRYLFIMMALVLTFGVVKVNAAESTLPFSSKSSTLTFNTATGFNSRFYSEFYDYAILEFNATEGSRATIYFKGYNDVPSHAVTLGKTVDDQKMHDYNKVYILPRIRNFGMPTDYTSYFGVAVDNTFMTAVTNPNFYLGYGVQILGINTTAHLTFYKL